MLDKESEETSTVAVEGAKIPFTDVGRACLGKAENNAPTPEEYGEGYGAFDNPAVKELYEDLCTAVSQQAKAGVHWGAIEANPDAAAEAVPKAFAHYAAAAIASFINNLDIEIELQAASAEDAPAAIAGTSQLAINVAGSATAQVGVLSITSQVSDLIEASTFKVTVKSKS